MNLNIPLEVNALVKNYGTFRAVDSVSFQVNPGEVFALLGPNGAGKTTIVSSITTLETPTSGSVSVFGHNVATETKQAKFLTGIVPQEIVNHGFFDVLEIMDMHSGYYGRWKNKERIEFLIQRLGLWEHRKKKVKQLSGGMKRRLLIAKALVHEPKLLLLDEPTAGVDIELRESLWQFVRELQKGGMSVLLTTHYLEEAQQLCQRVGILQKGVLKKVGRTQDLIRELTQRNVSIVLKHEMANIDSPYLVKQDKGEIHFQIPAHLEVGELLHQIQLDVKNVKDLLIREGSLEEAFRSVLKDSQGVASI